jgi:murein DD-endopeptidase MepM/ murein hydrolase activator NlpD
LKKVGDKVLQGEVIAKVGSTGQSTNPHCHFEVKINGELKNPLDYVKQP